MKRPSKTEAFDALLRTRLAPFIQKTFHTVDPGTQYLHNWHVDLIAEYLEACTKRQIKRLIINIPPRSLKSVCVSVAWPAWLLGHNPSERIMAASYSRSLSMKHNMDCRLVVQSDWYARLFPKTRLAPDQNEKHKFDTTARGMRYATSVGGSATGEGGNFLIIDDPHNPAQALSPVEREHALNWFDQTFSSRLNDKENGVIVTVMQRLNAGDLTAHLLAKGGWEHCNLPAIAETKTIIDFGRIKKVRNEGDLLHEAREGKEAIARAKSELGSYAFAGQYQQRPAPLEGGLFKAQWFKRYDKQKESYQRIIHSWDTAVKDKQINDPSCCTIWGEDDTGFDLLHVIVKRLQYPDLKASVISTADAWAPQAILIEDKASGQQLLQDLRRDTKLPIIAIMPKQDKITRASGVSAMIEAGRVRLPKNASWLADFESEMLTFPNAAHDDQVDSMSQFLDWIRTSFAAKIRIRSL